MRTTQKILTASALGFLLLTSACAKPTEPEVQTVEKVVVSTVQVQRPAPIVPKADALNLETLDWVLITPENVDEVLKDGGRLYALTPEGYKNLTRNMRDIFAHIEQKNVIIAVYERSYRR